MTLPIVAIAMATKPDVKPVIVDALSAHAELRFLTELDSDARDAAFDDAAAIIVQVLNRDLKDGELGRTGGKLIQTTIAGVDMVPFDEVPGDAVLAHNGGAFGPQMAEHIVGMILVALKDLFGRYHAMQRGEWIQWSPPTGELRGSTALIIGYGGIGKATARLLRAFDVKIEALNRSGRTDDVVDFIGTMADLETALPRADVVLLSAGLNAQTRGMINAKTLGLMKPNAVLVNVARGAVIVEADLYAHLEANPGFSACLDTWWGEPFTDRKFTANFPFVELPNVIGSPHNSGITESYLRNAAAHACDNVVRFLKTGRAERVVTAADHP